MALVVRFTFFSHLNSLKNTVKYNSNPASILFNLARKSVITSRLYSTDSSDADNSVDQVFNENILQTKKMSKAMLAYLERAKAYEEFITKEEKDYEFGRQHLANMMGQNPETFTQDDINNAISYLFPSGLFEPRARPLMLPPKEVFPPQKAAAFDETGRPFNFLFYTCRANYYEILHNIVDNINNMNKMEDHMLLKGQVPQPQDKAYVCKVTSLKQILNAKERKVEANKDLVGSTLVTKMELEKILLETILDKEYENFVIAMKRLSEHPLSNHAKDFMMQFRKVLTFHTQESTISKTELDADGRPYIIVNDCMRKTARAVVTLRGNGTGQITINGKDLSYFKDTQPREQVSYEEILKYR